MLIDQKRSHDPCYIGNQTWLSEEAPFGDFSSLLEWNKSFSLKTEWTNEKKKKVKDNWQEKSVDFSLHVFEVFEFSSYYYLKK